ncbi:hypothetical protein PCYB_134250 [Plasmodium cynomolgi strain B]|uniref:Uncharacterized protein n=1 Tax=Plasmodium cynomolgi (strain B) TaxID=1120755 RepID=K6UEL3_PLACD|nr:hypothetical protein PCYB_134250 [Plasmodium cynomolgi strain B]GAB68551.1 hypothetical protein PCYB_134250 [Plasmodium cynomolgi strain B]
MSAAAIGVENRCLMKNQKNNNGTCDSINVDINHIIKDIYGFKHGRKRSVQFINDDTLLNSQDMKKIIKRIKIQESYGSSSTGKHGPCDSESKQEEDSLTLPPQDATCINSEDAVKIGSGVDSDRGSDSGLDRGSDNGLDRGSDSGLDRGLDNGLDRGSDSGLDRGSVNGLDRGSVNGLDRGSVNRFDRGLDNGLDNNLLHSSPHGCTSNNHIRNSDKRSCPQEYDNFCENNRFVKRQASSNNQVRSDSTTESLIHREENRKILSKQFELCIDNVLEHIRSCNEINQAKKIMIPLLSEFILNNFMCLDDHERVQNGYKINIDTLQKEKKVLISAVKTQYQKIIQLQKLVHQYFYDINNPNKRIFSILSPDVY